jgi:predicted phosphodiesterase
MKAKAIPLLLLACAGCQGEIDTSSGDPVVEATPAPDDCSTCTDPDSPVCAVCIGSSSSSTGTSSPFQDATVVDTISLTEPTLEFAVVGDTRPSILDDTAHYPTAIITKIWQDVEAAAPPFAVSTGDYQFSRASGGTTGTQLDLYLKARSAFSGREFPAMGNHECTGATASNCGAGTKNGATGIYNAYLQKVLNPEGIHNPYYTVHVEASDASWNAKLVFVAGNAWTPAQASWLDAELAKPTTYTFVVRHEASYATTAPGVSPSQKIIDAHPYTLLLVGHTHTYRRNSTREVVIGNGGAPLTSGTGYGYGMVSRRASDGAIKFEMFHYSTHALLGSFLVKADGTATN